MLDIIPGYKGSMWFVSIFAKHNTETNIGIINTINEYLRLNLLLYSIIINGANKDDAPIEPNTYHMLIALSNK